MRDAIVKTQNLKKYYQVGNQVVKALDGVDFAVREREFVAIIENPAAERALFCT